MALSDGRSSSPANVLSRIGANPNLVFVVIILTALIAFEMFNYSTTDYALSDLLGDLKFVGIRWATILAIAFCGIDFAGIARLFTPQQGADEPKEVWYLFGAWLLAATMNAILTWWGVSMAVLTHNVQSTSIMDPNTLTKIIPVFVAIMVWVVRILIIGTLSIASDRLLNSGGHTSHRPAPSQQRGSYSSNPANMPHPISAAPAAPRPNGPRSINAAPSRPETAYPSRQVESNNTHAEPTYHSISASPRPRPVSKPSMKDDAGTPTRRF